MKAFLFACAFLVFTSSAHAAVPATQDNQKDQSAQVKSQKDGAGPYEQQMDQSMHDVVHQALADAAAHGLPGSHYFVINFLTDYPGVELSKDLREQHPKQMKIVLQYQFYDLQVDAEKMSVTLAFHGVPERLVIPFKAITDFSDPSNNVALHFAGKGTEESLTERNSKLLDESEQLHVRTEKMMDQQQKMLDQQQTDMERFGKILSTWEGQQKQYQSYLDSLKH